jgi:transcriptional antiterminator RfaH
VSGFKDQDAGAQPITAEGGGFGWYLIHAKPRQEEIALLNLERQGYECYLPRMTVHKVRRRKAMLVTEPMFSRYLFIKLSSGAKAQSWSPIRSTIGVSRMVQFGQTPAMVSEELVAILKEREASRDPVGQPKAGDKVIVLDGPFVGLEAVFEMADGEGRAMVLLEILGATARVALAQSAVSAAGAH